MGIHVVTPFSRPQNITALVENLRPSNVQWWPLCHEKTQFPDEQWIHPQLIKYPDEWVATGGICYSKTNSYIERGLFDDDMYAVLCDDDLYEPGFFDKIRAIRGDVIVSSMRLPDGRELVGAPQNCFPSRVGFEQLIIRGRIFKNYRYENHCQADGRLIRQVTTEHPTQFATDAFVLFNKLQ